MIHPKNQHIFHKLSALEVYFKILKDEFIGHVHGSHFF